jgi:TnpA family transposase
MREATYVLDKLLDNESDLDITEHTTDSAGYTEIVFALFNLLGYTFSPRIKDLADQQLYRPRDFDLSLTPHLKSPLSNILSEQRVVSGWDEMMRVVMSLKKGYCTASTLIQKLQAYPRKHPVARTLQEYGRLEKTIHILRWYGDLKLRKRINKQLNKGENLHFLRAAIAFGKHGMIDGKEDEALDQQFACLNLVTNAVIIYNTVQIARIVDDLKHEGFEVKDEDLARIWPSKFAHINFIGKYHFATERMRPDLM